MVLVVTHGTGARPARPPVCTGTPSPRVPPGVTHPFLWDLKVLSEMEEFRNLDNDIEGSAKRWKKFVESEVPEKEVFPKEWKSKTALQKLCMLRCMRPDRMTYAIRCWRHGPS